LCGCHVAGNFPLALIYKLCLQISEVLLRLLKTSNSLISLFFRLHPYVSTEKMGANNDTFIIVQQAHCIGGMTVPFQQMEYSKLRGWDEP